MIEGMELFRERGLIQGKWTPRGGASLTTYLVGAAVRSFRPAYMAWFRGQQTGQAELDTSLSPGTADEPQRDIPDQRAIDPYYVAATYDELARILPYITDPQVREGIGWRATGLHPGRGRRADRPDGKSTGTPPQPNPRQDPVDHQPG